jgi:hypothetical protein
MLISVRSQGELLETNPKDLAPIKARRVFIRLRQNTLQLAAGMNGGANAPKLEKRRRVGFGEFRFDTPQLAAGSFIREALVRRKFFDGVFVL